MKKLAIPTRGNVVDDHFGHCQHYTIFTYGNDREIASKESLSSPQGCGCKSDIASILQEIGVTTMLAGNMGNGALNVLNGHGITVYRGCSGDVLKVAQDYLAGAIKDSGDSCHQHAENHQCNH